MDDMNLTLRYEVGDAVGNEIDLNQLGASLQGFARILAVCAHLAHTGRYNKQFDALSVRVFASPVGDHHCYEILTTIKDIALSKELWSGFSGVILTLLVQYVFSKRSEEEMKHLSEALKQAMEQNSSIVDRLLSTVEKMANGLQPAARQALLPVGLSCKSVGVYKQNEDVPSIVLDGKTKEFINGQIQNTIENTREFTAVISEMDMETGTCRINLESDQASSRIPASITDPLGRQPNNVYVLAMSQLKSIKFFAKAEVNVDGEIVKLYISDIVPVRQS